MPTSLPVKFGFCGPPYPLDAIFEAAGCAESAGLDSFWLGDRIVGTRAPATVEAWSALAAVAVKTSRIRLGVGVADSFRRVPATFAQTVAAIDQISGGRLIPGLGSGEAANLTPFGVEIDRPAARLEEFVRLAKQYWTGKPVSFTGEFFRANAGLVLPTPLQQPHPPVWIAGNSPVSLSTTGRVGDGWLPAAKSPEMYREDLATVRAEAVRVGRDPGAITPALFAYALVSDDQEYVARAVADFARSHLVWWRNSLKRLGVHAGGSDLSIVNFDGTPEAFARLAEAGRRVPLEVAATLLTLGTPERVAARLQEFVDAGVEHFVVVPLDGLRDLNRWKATVSVFCDRIIPFVKAPPAGSRT